MGSKFDRCVEAVKADLKKRGKKGNPFAICTSALKKNSDDLSRKGLLKEILKRDMEKKPNSITPENIHKFIGNRIVK